MHLVLVRVHNFKDDFDSVDDTFHGPFDTDLPHDVERKDRFLAELKDSPLFSFCSFDEVPISAVSVADALTAQGLSARPI